MDKEKVAGQGQKDKMNSLLNTSPKALTASIGNLQRSLTSNQLRGGERAMKEGLCGNLTIQFGLLVYCTDLECVPFEIKAWLKDFTVFSTERLGLM